MPSVLYRYEVKRIQSWILATNQLTHLAGGSQIVEEVERMAGRLASECNGTLEQAGAGAGTIVFNSQRDMERFAEVWPLLIELHAPGATLVQAHAVVDPEKQELATANSELFNRLHATPRLPANVLPVAMPWAARAGISGNIAVPGRTKNKGWTDAASARKFYFYKQHSDGADFADLLPGPEVLPRRRFHSDVEQWSCSYVGVVHADGNAIGAMFSKMPTMDAHRALSMALREVTRGALKTSLAALYEREQKAASDDRYRRNGLRARPIVVGGDDMTIIVPGPHAVAFTHYYLKQLEIHANRCAAAAQHKEVASELRGFTAAAGVALVKKKWPFHQAHGMAEALCKRAKELTRDRNRPASALAFHRHTTSMNVDIDTPGNGASLMEAQLRGDWPIDGEAVYLQRLAWTTRELELLNELLRTIRRLPRGKARQYLAELKFNADAADQLWRRTATVAMGGLAAEWKTLQNSLKQIDATINGGEAPEPTGGEEEQEALAPLVRDKSALAGSRNIRFCPIGDALAWMALRDRNIDVDLWQNPEGGQQ